MKLLLRSSLYVLVTTVLFGAAYPAVVTLVAQLVWPNEANGSSVLRDGKVVGSALIGQNFQKPEYLHPRPSGAGKDRPLNAGPVLIASELMPRRATSNGRSLALSEVSIQTASLD